MCFLVLCVSFLFHKFIIYMVPLPKTICNRKNVSALKVNNQNSYLYCLLYCYWYSYSYFLTLIVIFHITSFLCLLYYLYGYPPFKFYILLTNINIFFLVRGIWFCYHGNLFNSEYIYNSHVSIFICCMLFSY